MYDFKQLSPIDFEELTRDLLQEHWQRHLESFKNGRDQGIDLRYATLQHPRALVVQCKHYAGSTVSKLLRHLAIDEMPKVRRLAPKRYVLATSLDLSPQDKDRLQGILWPFIRTTADVLGSAEINNLLRRHSSIERKHFKLWLSSVEVLQRVLHNAEQIQTDFDVERIRRSIPLYVQNANYSRALRKLKRHRVVVISGVPGIGKTTLADMLLFAHLESNYEPSVIVSDISEGRRRYREGARQIFYFDDFLGQTFLGNRFDFLGKKEDSAILDFIELIANSKHARMILTTREHILQHAYQISERFERHRNSIGIRKCVLELGNYTLLDRARILFNHIYFSDLPARYREQLLKNEFYLYVLRHPNFNPRLVEWLSKFANIHSLPARSYQREVKRVLDNPEQLWRVAFEQQISEASQSLLLALYSLGGTAELTVIEKAWRGLHKHRARKYNWKSGAENWIRSLRDLEGGFLRFDGTRASFINPSVRDFFDLTLSATHDHVDDLLATASVFHQVVSIWSLAQSEKGTNVLDRLIGEPERLIKATESLIFDSLRRDAEAVAATELSEDASNEEKLSTLISIGCSTKMETVVGKALKFAKILLKRWKEENLDLYAATEMLGTLDAANWQSISRPKLQELIRQIALRTLSKEPSIGDFEILVEYSMGRRSSWTASDQKVLTSSFRNYLDRRFEVELSECRLASQVDELERSLKLVAASCPHGILTHKSQLAEKRRQLLVQYAADDDDTHQWENDNDSLSEEKQHMEIVRIFDGLKA